MTYSKLINCQVPESQVLALSLSCMSLQNYRLDVELCSAQHAWRSAVSECKPGHYTKDST